MPTLGATEAVAYRGLRVIPDLTKVFTQSETGKANSV